MSKKLVAARDLPAGHVLTEDDIAAKSPGDGLPPSELDRLVGRRLGYPVTEELALTFDILEDPAADGRGRFERVGDEADTSPLAATAGGDEVTGGSTAESRS